MPLPSANSPSRTSPRSLLVGRVVQILIRLALVAAVGCVVLTLAKWSLHTSLPWEWLSRGRTNALPASASSTSASWHHHCQPDLGSWGLDGWASSVQYRRVHLAVTYSDAPLNFSQRLASSLPQSSRVAVDAPDAAPNSTLPCPAPIAIQVPTPPRTIDGSHLVFGVATTLERLGESLDAFSHWAAPAGTRIVALVEPSKGRGMEYRQVRAKARALNITLDMQDYSDGDIDRYLSLARLLYKHAPEARWAGIIDDDTFFLSIDALVSRLDSYDSRQPHYIGGLSESLRQIEKHGLMGFGGAGIFFSMPLLQQIQGHVEECDEQSRREESSGHRGRPSGGDWKLARCVYEHTATRLTWQPDLFQLDFFGDPSGFFEGGRSQPLSVHHWKSWLNVDVVKLAAVSALTGDAALLMRWRFADGWMLTNGYSVVQYSDGYPTQLHDDGPKVMEKTWTDMDPDPQPDSQEPPSNYFRYLHSLAPLRPKDENKRSFLLEKNMLDAAIDHPDNTWRPVRVRQLYTHRSKVDGASSIDSVIEVVWTMADHVSAI